LPNERLSQLTQSEGKPATPRIRECEARIAEEIVTKLSTRRNKGEGCGPRNATVDIWMGCAWGRGAGITFELGKRGLRSTDEPWGKLKT